MIHYRLLRSLAPSSILAAAAVASASSDALPPFGSWSPPALLTSLPDSGDGLNTPAVDGCASQSRDGLTLVFTSNRSGNFDLYAATRGSKTEGFGNVTRLPAPVNSSANDSCPTFGPGNRLYFSSDRDDPAYDLYVSKKGPRGWSSPENLGANVNKRGWEEESPAFYEADGHEVMVFSRRRLDGTGGKIYESVDGGQATLVAGGTHSSASDNRPSITHDGLTIFFDSDRYGTLGGPDLYYATRSSTSQPFGDAVHLESLSSANFDARPFISWDGTMLTFSSVRDGNISPAPDMWFSTRSKAVGR